MTNGDVVQLLRKIAAAYQILNENRFKIIAYERAADSIEHLTNEVKDMWKDGKLGDIPGVGSGIASSLDELFKTGKVRHFDDVIGKLPASIFPLLLVPGLGPKKAYRLVTELKLTDEKTIIADLEHAAKTHAIAPLAGFGEKSEADILANLDTYKRGQIKENRMVLSEADNVAREIMAYIRKLPVVKRIDTLGSLRRKVATIGDIDLSVATNAPQEVIEHFLTYPHQKLIEKGPTGASILLHNGRQVDLRVQTSEAYGAMLQYFTGSKNHNIALRSHALSLSLSLNEYGIKHVKTGKVTHYATEEDFYGALRMDWVAPELREDKGEITASIQHKLPQLLEVRDVKGDLHIHTSYDLEPSHDLGANSLSECLEKAITLKYSYLGFSDHNPSVGNHSVSKIVGIMEKRKGAYEQQYYSWTQKVFKKQFPKLTPPEVFTMCEVDILPDGDLALPNEAFAYVDAVIVSIHSSFTQNRSDMTKRVVKALTANPKVRIFGHPTGRLLGKREGVELDWKEIFAVCKERDIALEINAAPPRLDLPDNVVFDARNEGLRFCIDTDAHDVSGMDVMQYGVSVARRGWAEKRDIVNTLGYNEFKKWLIKSS